MVALLTAAGMGVPISEDLVLLLAGALAGQGITRFWPTLLGGYLGVLLGDLLIYHWGSRLGPAAYNHPRVRKHISPQRQEKLRAHFARHGFLTVVVGRHTPVLRGAVFFLAVASGARSEEHTSELQSLWHSGVRLFLSDKIVNKWAAF